MPVPAFHTLARIALTVALGAAAAGVCVLLNTPLPWMIGPLLATALGCLNGAPLASATPLRSAGQWVIGTALGLYFTPQVVGVVLGHWAAILAGIGWALALGASFGLFLRWANAGNASLDRATLFFASAIGGASEMTLLAQRFRGRADLVASAHSLRILLVVLIVPLAFQLAGLHGLDPTAAGPQSVNAAGLAVLAGLTLAGGAMVQRLGMANPWVLGPLAVAFALTACGIELSALPRWLVNGGQLFIGVALGERFTPAFVKTAPRWMATVAAGTLAMMVLSAGFAWSVAQLSGLHPATLMLGTSPGGIAEMCITAKVLQLGVPVVTAFHVTRMVAVVMLAEPIFRWVAGGR